MSKDIDKYMRDLERAELKQTTIVVMSVLAVTYFVFRFIYYWAQAL